MQDIFKIGKTFQMINKIAMGQDFEISFISFALSATLDQKPILNFSKYVHSLEAPTFIFDGRLLTNVVLLSLFIKVIK